MEPVFFIFHVERTGGTTLRQGLLRQYGAGGKVYQFYPRPEPFVLDGPSSVAQFFIGHSVFYGMHEIIQKPPHYMAFFRDPFERMQSLFNHARILAVRHNQPVPDFKTWFSNFSIATQIWALSKENPKVNVAKEIMDKMSFIGLYENFQSDLDQLFYPYRYIKTINSAVEECRWVNLKPVKFTDEEASEVRSVLVEDYELYKYALELRQKGRNKGFAFPSLKLNPYWYKPAKGS